MEGLVSALKRLGLSYILELEARDPQYLAICRLKKIYSEEEAARLAAMNALVSYRLAGRGEEHWDYFSRYFSSRRAEDLCTDFLRYVDESPYLRLNRDARKRRAARLCAASLKLEDLESVWRTLSALFGSEDQKTVVFATKILNYVYMCYRGIRRPAPFSIPIPVDYRVAYLTSCLGLVDMKPEEAMRRHKAIQATWDRVARESGIPSLHIDTLLWLAGRAVIYGENVHSIPEEVLRLFRCKKAVGRPQHGA